MMAFQHTTLADGRWQELSLLEQLGNVGSEVHRAILWRTRDPQIFENSIHRALELLDLTIADPRWRRGVKEFTRVREFLCNAVWGSEDYGTSLEDTDHYFFQFALAAQIQKHERNHT